MVLVPRKRAQFVSLKSPLLLFLILILIKSSSQLPGSGGREASAPLLVDLPQDILDRQRACLDAYTEMASRGYLSRQLFSFRSNRSENERELLAEYDLYCLETMEQVGPITTSIFRNVLVLVYDGSPERNTAPTCLGFFIGPRRIVTARHCVQNQPSSDEIYYRSVTDLTIRSGQILPASLDIEFSDRSDFFAFQAADTNFFVDGIEYREEVPFGQPTIIPMINYSIMSHPSDLEQVLDYLRIDNDGSCARLDNEVFLSQNAIECMFYECQTLPGASGAPILSVDDAGRVYIGGVHLRSGVRTRARTPTEIHRTGCGYFDDYPYVLNVGIPLTNVLDGIEN